MEVLLEGTLCGQNFGLFRALVAMTTDRNTCGLLSGWFVLACKPNILPLLYQMKFLIFLFLSLLKKCVSPLPQCALELLQHSTFLYSQELDSFSNICLRALDGSSYEVRCAVAQLLGSLLSLTRKPLPPAMRGKLKLPSLEEALMILSNGFVRGASGFLKAGGPELLKGGAASRETRVGVTQVLLFCRER